MASNYKPVFFDMETTGFNPTVPSWYSNSQAARVTAVSIGEIIDWTEDGDKRSMYTVANDGGMEYETIEKARDALLKIESDYADNGWEPFLVGHNIIKFDVMYWAARAARYRIDPNPVGGGWRRLDTLRALTIPADAEQGSSRYPGQQDYADYLGLDYKDELDGSDMPEAFKNGDYAKIKAHVKDDVSTLMDIFMLEREDMVDELWGHYDDGHEDEIDEPEPVFNESVNIDL
jgi:hypothetical protein